MQKTLVTRRIGGLHISTGADVVGGGGQGKRAVRHPVQSNYLTGGCRDGRKVALKAGYTGLGAVASRKLRPWSTTGANRFLARLVALGGGTSHGTLHESSGHEEDGEQRELDHRPVGQGRFLWVSDSLLHCPSGRRPRWSQGTSAP